MHGDPAFGGTPHGLPMAFLTNVVMKYLDDTCLIWPFAKITSGCAELVVTGQPQRVPRIICTDLYGPPPSPEHDAAHSCGNGHLGCVNPKHLRWATKVENAHDKIGHGTHIRGEAIKNSKLTESDVRTIRSMKGEVGIYAVAEQFGIAIATVSRVWNRIDWAWLE